MSLLIDALKKAERIRVMQSSTDSNRDKLLALSANELEAGPCSSQGMLEIEKVLENDNLASPTRGNSELTPSPKEGMDAVINWHTELLPKDDDPFISASSILSQWSDTEQDFKPSPVDSDISNESSYLDEEGGLKEEDIESRSEVERRVARALFIRKTRRLRHRVRILYLGLSLAVTGFCAVGYLYWQLLEVGVSIAPLDSTLALSEMRAIRPTSSISPESGNALDIIPDPSATLDTSIDPSVTVAKIFHPIGSKTSISTDFDSEKFQSLASDIATFLPLRGDFTSSPTQRPIQGEELIAPSVMDELATSELKTDSAPTDRVPEADSMGYRLKTPQIKIITQRGEKPVAQSINRAYQAYWQGEDALAESLYRGVLRREPKAREALLGLASLAMRREDIATAMHHYQEILRLFPQDRVARSALLQKKNGPHVGLDKHQIETLLQEFPNASYLNFSIGNLYAAQSQWSLARVAYLRALRADSTNPDYAFNVAVSLEHLHQPGVALHFYKSALGFARLRSATFVREAAKHRVQVLHSHLSRESAL